MIKERASEFRPGWVSSPGDTISDLLREKSLPLEDFSSRLGCSVAETRELLQGSRRITLALARKLQSTLGSSVEFWISRDHLYQKRVLGSGAANAEARKWVNRLPVKDMVRFGWIGRVTPSQEVAECLRFFGVHDLDAWRSRYVTLIQGVAYRTSRAFESDTGALAAWLRRGELDAEQIECGAWSPELFARSVSTIRNMTRVKDPSKFMPEIRRVCAAAGVAVVIVRAPEGVGQAGPHIFYRRTKPFFSSASLLD